MSREDNIRHSIATKNSPQCHRYQLPPSWGSRVFSSQLAIMSCEFWQSTNDGDLWKCTLITYFMEKKYRTPCALNGVRKPEDIKNCDCYWFKEGKCFLLENNHLRKKAYCYHIPVIKNVCDECMYNKGEVCSLIKHIILDYKSPCSENGVKYPHQVKNCNCKFFGKWGCEKILQQSNVKCLEKPEQ